LSLRARPLHQETIGRIAYALAYGGGLLLAIAAALSGGVCQATRWFDFSDSLRAPLLLANLYMVSIPILFVVAALVFWRTRNQTMSRRLLVMLFVRPILLYAGLVCLAFLAEAPMGSAPAGCF